MKIDWDLIGCRVQGLGFKVPAYFCQHNLSSCVLIVPAECICGSSCSTESGAVWNKVLIVGVVISSFVHPWSSPYQFILQIIIRWVPSIIITLFRRVIMLSGVEDMSYKVLKLYLMDACQHVNSTWKMSEIQVKHCHWILLKYNDR